jgi:hypothetical protein
MPFAFNAISYVYAFAFLCELVNPWSYKESKKRGEQIKTGRIFFAAVCLNFWPLDARFVHVWCENQIPRPKLHILLVGGVLESPNLIEKWRNLFFIDFCKMRWSGYTHCCGRLVFLLASWKHVLELLGYLSCDCLRMPQSRKMKNKENK